jgi:uncharacterized cupredoxin-like copper-binding protein
MSISTTGRRLAAGAILATAFAVGGCGSSSNDNNTTPPTPAATPPAAMGGGTTLQLKADTSALAFDKKALSAKAGKVTIVMTNPAQIPHDVALDGNGVEKKGEIVSAGGKSEVSATLKAGTYTFYCSVPGHEQAGMKGTLTVK